jgi:hypothetical protein
MNLHLAEIAAAVEPAAHAVLLVDQAGWHGAAFAPANDLIDRAAALASIRVGMVAHPRFNGLLAFAQCSATRQPFHFFDTAAYSTSSTNNR